MSGCGGNDENLRAKVVQEPSLTRDPAVVLKEEVSPRRAKGDFSPEAHSSIARMPQMGQSPEVL